MSSGDNITKRGSSRRKFLAITSTAAAAGIAGCAGSGGGSGGGGASSGGAKSGSTTSKSVIKGGGGSSSSGRADRAPPASAAVIVGSITIPSKVASTANDEGEVVVYSTMDEPDLLKYIVPGFEEAFPGIKMTVQGLGSGELSTKLISEKRVGKVMSDATTFNLGASRSIAPEGVFVGFGKDHWLKKECAAMGYDPTIHEKSYEVPGYGNAYTLIYNTELTTEAEAPSKWEDLGDDKWSGQQGIVMQHPAQLSSMGGLFSTLYGKWGHDKWVEVVGNIMDNTPQIISSNSASYRVLLQGEKALSPNYINDLAAQLGAGESPPAQCKWLDPGLLNNTPGHVTAGAKHPNAGLCYAAWFASELGQMLVGDTGRTPVFSPVAATHDLFKVVIPEGTSILPTGFNNPKYNGTAYLEEPDAFVPLFEEHFGGR